MIDVDDSLLAKEAALIEERNLVGGGPQVVGNPGATAYVINPSTTLSDVTNGINASNQDFYPRTSVGDDTTFDWFAYHAYRQNAPVAYAPYTGTFHTDHVGGDTIPDQKLWPLSAAEASLLHPSIRNYSNKGWWLRTPSIQNDGGSIVAGNDQIGMNQYYNYMYYAVRPALNLNLTNVKFSSAASGANSKSAAIVGNGFAEATAPANGEKIKFTMLDTSGQSKPDVTITSSPSPTNLSPLTLNYSGASAGPNQFLSAVLRDKTSGDVVYYARLADTSSSDSGTASVSVANVPDGNYTLEVFSEQINGENNTDFCSAPATLPSNSITVDNIPPTLSNESATRINTSDATVKFTSDEPGTYYYQIDGTPPTAASLAAAESNPTALIATEQTINLNSLTSGAHTIYVVAKDAAGYASNMLTIDIPQEKIFKVIEHFGTHILGSNKTAEAKIDYSNYEDMIGLFYDGKEISKEYYKVSSGSTVITLDAAYLNRCKVGTYDKFVAEFKDGSSELITLRITSGVPGTGDDANQMRIIVVAGLALLSLFIIQVVMVILMRRSKVST